MNQSTLYRKYRPIDFDTVVGQDAIITTLKNQIINNKVSHAYLFCGTRGTGKTTVAKIFARALNCENKKVNDANPCNECDTCQSILQNKDININEIDAAANNGIDDIRNIIELTQYPPTNNEKYKVFIIDEAHELSDKARDAFLKTLEEPPSYVIFILCTTEPHKFKQTILSRCQRYDFKRISIENIVKYLKEISTKENINIDDDALLFIAQRADGSMRESISLLDRVQSFNNEKIDLNIAQEILGVSDEKYFKELTLSLIQENAKEAIVIINEVINAGKEISQFTNDYIWYLRNIMIAKNLDKPNEVLSITKEKFEEIKELSNTLGINTLMWYIDILSETANIMKQDENKRIQIETCFIRMCTPQGDFSKEGLINRIDILENKLNSGSYFKVFDVKKNDIEDNEETNKKQTKQEEIKNEIKQTKTTQEKTNNEIKKTTINDSSINKIKEVWKEIVADLDRVLYFLKDVELKKSDREGFVSIISENPFVESLVESRRAKPILKSKTKELTGLDVEYEIISINKEEKLKDRKTIIKDNLNEKGIQITIEE